VDDVEKSKFVWTNDQLLPAVTEHKDQRQTAGKDYTTELYVIQPDEKISTVVLLIQEGHGHNICILASFLFNCF
jgi:hypothetical protein